MDVLYWKSFSGPKRKEELEEPSKTGEYIKQGIGATKKILDGINKRNETLLAERGYLSRPEFMVPNTKDPIWKRAPSENVGYFKRAGRGAEERVTLSKPGQEYFATEANKAGISPDEAYQDWFKRQENIGGNAPTSNLSAEIPEAITLDSGNLINEASQIATQNLSPTIPSFNPSDYFSNAQGISKMPFTSPVIPPVTSIPGAGLGAGASAGIGSNLAGTMIPFDKLATMPGIGLGAAPAATAALPAALPGAAAATGTAAAAASPLMAALGPIGWAMTAMSILGGIMGSGDEEERMKNPYRRYA